METTDYAENEIERFKQYARDRSKRWYQQRKEELAQKVKCDYCGSTVRLDGMSGHYKSMKCLKIPIEKVQEINKLIWRQPYPYRVFCSLNRLSGDS